MRKSTVTVGSAVGAFLTASLASMAPATGYAQGLEEIVVTTRKQEESLQDVPIAIKAIGAEEIDRLGIKDLNQLAQQDTSVQFDQGFTPSDTRITIRGLSPTRGRPNAATLIDGIDVTSEAVSNAGGSVLINPRLIDIQQIEIVKGPQSALYGRSAFAGAVQYITKDPGDTLAADVFVDANSVDNREVRATVDVPITDTLGMLINGTAWDNRGIYRNVATGDFVGGGDGTGASITFKWEPTDNLDFKWRTEYSDDNFDVPPQTLLNDRNKFYDLGNTGQLDTLLGANNPRNGGSNLAPNSSNCFIGNDANGNPNPAVGPLDNYGCREGQALLNYFLNPFPGDNADLGAAWDPSDVEAFNQYNKQVTSVFVGQIPDADELQVALQPNYQFGIGADNPARAVDYEGVERDVFRTSLVANWGVADNLTVTSYTGFTTAKVYESLDLGKRYVDNCRPNFAALDVAGSDPTGTFNTYREALLAQGLTEGDLAKFAPQICGEGLADGIDDSPISFVQNSETDTTQISQEFRANWDISNSLNFTTGILYWRERVEQTSLNSTTITQGNQCYIGDQGAGIRDSSQTPGGQFFTQTDPIQDQCSRTQLAAAYWVQDTYRARQDQLAGAYPGFGDKDITKRGTDHYSWYGSLDWSLDDAFNIPVNLRFEARYTREDNDVTGLVQNPCLDNSLRPGDPGCQTTPAQRLEVGAGGQPTGPSTVIVCGQIGRCDRLGIAPVSGSPYVGLTPQSTDAQYSWWAWGFAPMPGNSATLDRTDRFWAPKATAEWMVNDDVLLYVSWARGIKPGGFSLLTSGAFGLDANLDGQFDEIEFDPERLDVYELGWKTTLFDGRVRFNGAYGFQDFKDKQVTVQAVVGNTVGTKVDNISGTEITFLEMDLTWQITDAALLSGGWTFLPTAEYTDYTVITSSANDIVRINLGKPSEQCQNIRAIPNTNTFGCEMSLNGNRVERSPRHSLSADFTYTKPLFDTGKEWYGQVNWRYQSERYVEQWNIVEFKAYDRTNVSFGIVADLWDVQFYVDNVFDDLEVITGGANPGIPTGNFGFGIQLPPIPPGVNAGPKLPSDIYAQLPDPRIAGVRANFRFGG